MSKIAYQFFKHVYAWFVFFGVDSWERAQSDLEIIIEKDMSFIEALKFMIMPPETYEKTWRKMEGDM